MDSATVVPVRRMRYADDMEAMFDQITTLTSQQRNFIKERYRFLLSEYRRRCLVYSILFYILRITMTVGSLAVPALLSIQSTGDPNTNMYWMTWSISLAVTTANGLTTLFKLDKRFFLLHGVAERLRTEAWQYLTLSGRYSGHHGVPEGDYPTHQNQYVYYCSHIEKIRMKHIDDEFIRQADVLSGQQPAATNSTSSSSTTGSTTNMSQEERRARRAAATSGVLVPTPLDPVHLRDRQRQSVASVGSNETAIEMETPNGEAIRTPPNTPEERDGNTNGSNTVSVSEQRRESMPTESDEEQSVLSRTRAVRRVHSVRVGATVSPRQIQPEQGNPGSA